MLFQIANQSQLDVIYKLTVNEIKFQVLDVIRNFSQLLAVVINVRCRPKCIHSSTRDCSSPMKLI